MSSVQALPAEAPGLRILAVGESAVLAECTEPGRILPLYTRMRHAAVPGVVDLVPAEVTLLVAFDPAVTTRARIIEALEAAAAQASTVHGTVVDVRTRRHAVVDIAVRYDGPDVGDVVRSLGLAGIDELIELHTQQLWTAAFLGFAPGFAYLRGEHYRLDLPRRATPRTTVPAGAVALAAGYCGIYPRPSPGGWHVIGTTPAPLWDAAREPASLLEPGSRVRFHRAG